MRYSNLHTHSTFSDGKHSLEENIISALEKDMLSIGFSDHSFTSCDTSYCMPETRYQDYWNTIQGLKQKYGSQLPIFAGLELDYYSNSDVWTHRTDFNDFRNILYFDYVIASVHYIIKDGICYPIDHSLVQQLDCIQNAFHGDVYAMAQCYFDMLCEHVERIKPTLVGHFDVITKFGQMPEEDERYRSIAQTALKRIIKTCPYIEVNTGAIARGWRKVPYPASYLFETLRVEGGEIVLSSDSHHRDNLIYGFDEAAELLKQAGFDHICVFNGNKFETVGII